MDRVIKFRGKDKDSNLVIGDLIHGVGNCYGKVYILPNKVQLGGIPNCDPLNGVCVLPETIGQFTGYHDANGKEIYEGDILKNHSCEYDGNALYKIYWEENECGFAVEPINEIAEHEEVRKWHWLEDFEIIGNIHDNPELSEGGGQ